VADILDQHHAGQNADVLFLFLLRQRVKQPQGWEYYPDDWKISE
jgi:hypothetical protein